MKEMNDQNIERTFMERAVAAMENSKGTVRVGAVLVANGEVIAVGSKQNGIHAERSAIETALQRGLNLKNATLYTTLEPCIDIGTEQKQRCCADLVISAGIQEVVIGRYDPNPNVHRRGWKRLRDAGVRLKDFPDDLRNSIDLINENFMNFFSMGIGPKGGAKISHRKMATFRVQFSEEDKRFMDISWTLCGVDAAYGYAVPPVKVAAARFANRFNEIDDPTAYDFAHSERIDVNEVGIFLGPEACVLVYLKEVQSGPDYGSNDCFVKFDYQVRLL